MQKYAVQLAYDGTDFCGWQSQPGTGTKPSIEDAVNKAITELCNEPVKTVASGRTDAGVHANGQVAHFTLQQNQSAQSNLLQGINHRLPETIRVVRLGKVPDSFSARSACKKQYSYYFLQGPSNLPHLKRYTVWNRRDLDINPMQTAITSLVGSHDFTAFCSAGSKVSSTERTIFEAEVTCEPIPLPGNFDHETHRLIKIKLSGSGFLKQMVRTIVGTLKQIGELMRSPDDMITVLHSLDRNLAGPTAPAEGLWLDKVWYPKCDEIDFLYHFDDNQSKM